MIEWLVRFLVTPAELYIRIIIALFGGGKFISYDSGDPNPSLIQAPNFKITTNIKRTHMLLMMEPFYVPLDLAEVEELADSVARARDAMREAAGTTNPRAKHER